MRRTRACALLLATAEVVACVVSLRRPDPASSGDVRPPVLGYRLLVDGQTGEHLLVHEGREVARGERAECEQALVVRLKEEHGTGKANVPFPTFGGVQFWSDVYWYAGWRIQENLVTGHCRLLEPSGTRRAWGTYVECRTAFEEIRLEQKPEAPGGELIVLVHGLGRSRASMASMEDALREQGYAAYRLTYASTRGSLEEHARRLRHLLERLEGVERVSFVTHSMGGIVVRELFRVESAWSERTR